MANKSDNYLAHVEALKEFLPHAPELNSGGEWNSDFSYYKVTESHLNYNMLTSAPNWTKIDIRRSQAIACYAPVGWILLLTDLPNHSPIAPSFPMTNIIQLLPGQRIGVANKDWIHATWLPNFSVTSNNIIVPTNGYTPEEKYLVVEHNPNKPFISPMTFIQAGFTKATEHTQLYAQVRNIYRHRLFFRFAQTGMSHPSCTMTVQYRHLYGTTLFIADIPVPTNNVYEVTGVLRPQEEVHVTYLFGQAPPTTYFELAQASEGLI